ncbi:hypothetical protein K2173_005989 [Erythroxylum novogranatense]|uniref:GDSL esterase/lipase EXL3 n=1 Tax=Erythroxylum novogranatense TaxID=1862640 RepID=A0AAV8TE20_9ROSI|nr:hypothetical protein K2173_005989 [Erythroxylum novogranatense]
MKLFSGKLGSSPFLVILCVLVATFVPIFNAAEAVVPKIGKFPAFFVFGDSIVDPGNNNYIETIARCNFRPYGRDFLEGKPTGRFSNGRIPSDLIAEELGIKKLVPAYLDQSLQVQDLLTGVSFASGAAGYDPLTSQTASVVSLRGQVDLFRDYVQKIMAAVGEERADSIVSQSFYFVCIGSDDIANTYPFRKAQYDIDSYTDLMVIYASSFYKELYGVGARKIAILGLPPIGCVPSQRTLSGGIERECSDFSNHGAVLFNSKISSTIDHLNKELPDVRMVYGDVYNPLLSLIKTPAQYGFVEATKGCCGTGNIEVSILCNHLSDATTCKDASKYIFWDSYHPTEKAYQVLVPIVLGDLLDKLSKL